MKYREKQQLKSLSYQLFKLGGVIDRELLNDKTQLLSPAGKIAFNHLERAQHLVWKLTTGNDMDDLVAQGKRLIKSVEKKLKGGR